MTTPKNPQGQYQVPPGYRPQTQAVPWSGSYKGSQPRIKGVSALQAAAIKNDWRNKTGLPGSGGPSAQELAEQADDQEAARQAVRQTAFEKGYENMRKGMGFGPKDAPPTALTPEQHQRQQLILGGLQPHEADAAIAQTKAATAPPAPSAANPTPGAPTPAAPAAVPAAAPAGTPAPAPAPPASAATVGPDGRGGSLADWIAANKARQANPQLIGPSADDAAALPSATAHVAEIDQANSPLAAAAQAMRPIVDPREAAVARNAQQAQDQVYPEKSAKVQAGVKAIQARTDAANASDIKALGYSMRPDTMGPGYNPSASAAAGAQSDGNADEIKEPQTRAMGGPVKGKPIARAGGGPVMATPSVMPPTWVGAAPRPPAAPGETPAPASAPVPGAYPAARPTGSMGSFSIGPPANKYGREFPYTAQPARGLVVPARKKGGPVKAALPQPGKPAAPVQEQGQQYKVGEKGPELFMPDKEESPPSVIGQNGPETGAFPEDGTVIPNHALKQMRAKFSQQKTNDDDQGGAPPAMAAVRSKMRPQAA